MSPDVRIVHVEEFSWNVFAIDDGVDEPVGRVSRREDGFFTYTAEWRYGDVKYYPTGLKFDSLHEAAAALADASRVP